MGDLYRKYLLQTKNVFEPAQNKYHLSILHGKQTAACLISVSPNLLSLNDSQLLHCSYRCVVTSSNLCLLQHFFLYGFHWTTVCFLDRFARGAQTPKLQIASRLCSSVARWLRMCTERKQCRKHSAMHTQVRVKLPNKMT